MTKRSYLFHAVHYNTGVDGYVSKEQVKDIVCAIKIKELVVPLLVRTK